MTLNTPVKILDDKYTINVLESPQTFAGVVRKISITGINFMEKHIVLIDGPTHKCQLSIMGSFVNISIIPSNDLREIVKFLFKNIPIRKILQIDVNRSIVEKIANTFPNEIIGNYAYSSTNGSSMNIILINCTLL